jgi:hypothetical protein
VGSFGNIGGVVFSSVLFFTATSSDVVGDTTVLFAVIAASALLVGMLCLGLLRVAAPGRSVIDLDGLPGSDPVAADVAPALVHA